nr:uncharacterized protein LOC128702480 isoform X3 [Cherax quadricarinatus]
MHVVTSPWKHLSCFVLFVQLFLPNFFFLTMGPKKVSAKNSAEKRKRMMSIHLKHEIIEKHERGVRVVDLARQYMRNTSTICTILKQKELLKAISPAMGIKIISKQRTSVHEEMEKLLLTWLTEKQLAGDTVAEGIICEMARGIYAELLQQTPGTSSDEALEKPFKASRGWLEKFKRRTGIHSVIRQGSQPSGQEEKKSPVVICLDLPDESCTIYKEISNVPENSQKKMRNEESMGGDVSETQKLDVSIKAKEGVWRSGRVRKRSSKLADFASTAEVDVLFRQYSDGPGSLHNDSNKVDTQDSMVNNTDDDVIDVKDEPLKEEVLPENNDICYELADAESTEDPPSVVGDDDSSNLSLVTSVGTQEHSDCLPPLPAACSGVSEATSCQPTTVGVTQTGVPSDARRKMDTPSTSKNENPPQKYLTSTQTIDICRRLEQGEDTSVLMKEYKIGALPLRSIRSEKDRLLKFFTDSLSYNGSASHQFQVSGKGSETNKGSVSNKGSTPDKVTMSDKGSESNKNLVFYEGSTSNKRSRFDKDSVSNKGSMSHSGSMYHKGTVLKKGSISDKGFVLNRDSVCNRGSIFGKGLMFNKESASDKGSSSNKGVDKRKLIPKRKLEVLDAVLYEWLKLKWLAGVQVSRPTLSEKANDFYKKLNVTNQFLLSEKWLSHFITRHGVRLDECDEQNTDSHETAETCSEIFASLVEEHDLSPEQIYNAKEMHLFWRCLPASVLVGLGESSAMAARRNKDSLMVLTCANAAGTHRLKLLVVGKCSNPRAIKHVTHLPVVYKAQSNSWLDKENFQDWFYHHFEPEVKQHFKKIGLPQASKAILILDNCRADPNEFELVSGNIFTTYLPSNVTSLIQPMEQGVIQTIKSNYRRDFLRKLAHFHGSIQDFQAAYSMKDAIYSVACAWNDIKSFTLRKAWIKLWPNVMFDVSSEEEDFEGFGLQAKKSVFSILDVFKNALPPSAVASLHEDDFQEWLDADQTAELTREVTDDDIIQSVLNPVHETSEEEDYEVQRVITWAKAIENLKELIEFTESKACFSAQEVMLFHRLHSTFLQKRHSSTIQEDIRDFFKKASKNYQKTCSLIEMDEPLTLTNSSTEVETEKAPSSPPVPEST